MTAPAQDRGDFVWQDAGVVANYQVSSKTIPFFDSHFEVANRVIEASGVSARNVLDLGAGDGIMTFEVAKRQPVERVTMTEFSEPMLDLARKRCDDELPPFTPTFIVGDFRERGWQDEVMRLGPYDAVISRFAIHHIPDDMKRAVYGDILRFLRPGGIFVHIEHVASLAPMYNDAHDRWLVESMYGAASGTDQFDEVMASYRLRADGPANILAPVEKQLQWLRELGFVDVDLAFKSFELAVFAGRRPTHQGAPRAG